MKEGDLITVPGPCRSVHCKWNHCNKHEPKIKALFLGRDPDDFMQVLFSGKIFTCSVNPNMQIDCETKRWFKNGKLHRDGDEPAVIRANGNKRWLKNDKLHRDGDKPAAIYADGTKYWFKDGKQHRDGDGPAVICADGDKEWYKNGKLHRDGDKPAAIYADGTKYWFKDGKQHRDGDEPAVIHANGDKFWYKNGKQHRDGGKPSLIQVEVLVKNDECIKEFPPNTQLVTVLKSGKIKDYDAYWLVRF